MVVGERIILAQNTTDMRPGVTILKLKVVFADILWAECSNKCIEPRIVSTAWIRIGIAS
jgi:hypothetical protein